MMEITARYTAYCAIMLVLLALNIIRLRYKYRLLIGDGERESMQRAIRAQGNFLEYTPFFLFMLALLEVRDVAPAQLQWLGAIFLIGRISHAYSLLFHEIFFAHSHLLKRIPFRSFGMAATFYVLLTQAHGLLV